MNEFFEAFYRIISEIVNNAFNPVINLFDNFSDDAFRGLALFIVLSLFVLMAIGYIYSCFVRSKYEK